MPKKTNCLYSQVADALIAQINGHMYGKLLPSERALCEQYQVSRTTIRQALHLLAQRGYVDSVRGKGMVVSHPQLLQELHSVYNFHEEMRRQGKRPETHMVDFVVQAASGGLASVFSLPEGSPVYRMIRLRLADGVPPCCWRQPTSPISAFLEFSRKSWKKARSIICFLPAMG